MNEGLYQLIIRLRRPTVFSPGKLGKILLPGGSYVYTGSARRNLRARIARHGREEKRFRWHIDYLLQYGIIKRVLIYSLDQLTECELNRSTLEALEGEFPVKYFGSSDCRCRSHLILIPKGMRAEEVGKAVGAVAGVTAGRLKWKKGWAVDEMEIVCESRGGE